jgi:hypothetical protein
MSLAKKRAEDIAKLAERAAAKAERERRRGSRRSLPRTNGVELARAAAARLRGLISD